MMRLFRMHLVRIALALMLATLMSAATGCARKPTSQGVSPDGVTPSGGMPAGATPAAGAAAPGTDPRLAPYSGQGLPDPYINDKGEIELVFADSRGTVKLGADNGWVTTARLAPDRTKLAYAVAQSASLDDQWDERVYIVDATGTPWQEREIPGARDGPIGELAFSPCGQYLTVDSGTSVVRALGIFRVADGAIVGGAGVLAGAVWSPDTPSRLAIGLVTERPLVLLTELDCTIDAAVIEFPSGRLTYIRRGTVNEFWAPRRWTADDRIELEHSALFPSKHDTLTVSVPARPASADATYPAEEGPLPAETGVHPEIDARARLLLVAEDGTVQRVVERQRGGVIDCAVSDDGQTIVYTRQAENEAATRLYRVSLPDVSVSEIDIGPYNGEHNRWGPRGLSFAPGSARYVLACWGFQSARVYDLASGTCQDIFGDLPTWVPSGDIGGSPKLVVGQNTSGESGQAPADGGGLVLLDVGNGSRTVLAAGSRLVNYYPLGFDGGSALALKQGAMISQELIRVALPD